MAPTVSTVPEPLTGQAVAHTFPAEPVVRLRVETQPRCTAADRARAATASKLMRAERTLRLIQAGCSFGRAIAMIIPEMTRTSAISTSVNPRRFKGGSPILVPSDREDCKSFRPRGRIAGKCDGELLQAQDVCRYRGGWRGARLGSLVSCFSPLDRVLSPGWGGGL